MPGTAGGSLILPDLIRDIAVDTFVLINNGEALFELLKGIAELFEKLVGEIVLGLVLERIDLLLPLDKLGLPVVADSLLLTLE